MNQYLKSYQVIMHTVGPVFIGSGREIGKKEYLFLNRRQAGIPDIQLLYAELKKRNLADDFEEYMLGKGNVSLTQWLEQHQISVSDLDGLIKYKLECSDAVLEKNSAKNAGRPLQVLECMKDAYGMPYIPGSSLKGMFRTILLGANILKNPEKYRGQKECLHRNANSTDWVSRKSFLKSDTEGLEGITFRTLERPESKPMNAVNDILQGLIISDSEPLCSDDLVLCQKIDRYTDGDENALPILRECIKPDTEIRFTITVDTEICQLSKIQLVESIKLFITEYYKNFAFVFEGMEAPKGNYVFCGGGCGFVSKTIVYPLFGKQEGIRMAQHIFEKTNVPKQHKHNLDKQYGASPHTIKCTRYRGKLFQMGMCKIDSIESI